MPPPQTLPSQPLGKDGPLVPSLGFGLMGLSVGYGQTPDDEARLRVLDRAWELGSTFWDTSGAYGDNELLVGKWFKLHPERRGDVFLATKFGLSWSFVDGNLKFVLDSSPEACRRGCEKSLERLGVESVDLFYVHRFDKVTPVEKTMEALVELKREGKVKHFGFSECSSNTLRRGHAIHPIAAVQIEYSPWTLDIEGDSGTNLLGTCRELGVAVVPYSPLGRGFLTGRYRSLDDFDSDDARRRMPRFQPENFTKNLTLVRVFEALAADKGCTPAQVVLAWITAQGPDFFPIPGTKNIGYLEQNLGAVAVEVTPKDDGYIRETIGSVGGAIGDRSLAMAETVADTPPLL